MNLRVMLALTLAGALAAACGDNEGDVSGQRPAQVGYVTVETTSAAATVHLLGRTVAFQASEVRPQATGVIKRRLFDEGADVRIGQPLYEIDYNLYAADVDRARADLRSAEANLAAARAAAERYRPLADIEAISAQDLTNAEAAAQQAAAVVAQRQAALRAAETNLRFTTVPSPITGRIGRSLFTVGALVTANQAAPLATIQQLDPMFIDIQQSSAQLIALRRDLSGGRAASGNAKVRLTLEDGAEYPHLGVLQFSEAVVEPTTGTVTLRVRAPNPDGLLLPGMFVRASFEQRVERDVVLVPQQALSRTARGEASVWVVDASGKAQQKIVSTDRTQGAFWVVTAGLAAGDKLITQGLAGLRPGVRVEASPAEAARPRDPRARAGR